MRPKIFVEPWDPGYGTTLDPDELSTSSAEVDPTVELSREKWRPLPPESAPAQSVIFVDGVRRMEALVWLVGEDGRARLGLCASYASGVVKTSARAEIREVTVKRGLFTSVAEAGSLETTAGAFTPENVRGESRIELETALRERLRELEVRMASSCADAELVVIDGPLSARHERERTVGYVKSHHVHYLEPELEAVVHRLAAFERTPLFLTTTSWSRFSAYLRLASAGSHPFAGVVRLEVAGDRTLQEARRDVAAAAATLPRYASVPHKDPRAPQNLFPIGGLERELRHRLGDAALVHRALRAAAHER